WVPMPFRVSLFVFAFAISAHAAPSCQLNPASPTVTICSPANGSTVTSPISISAGTTDAANPVKLLQVYVDGTKKYEIAADNLDTSLAISAGAHRVTVQATDTANTIFKSTVNITVSGAENPSACTLNTASPSVTICAPLNGSSGPSPIQVKAGTTDNASPVKLMQIYADGIKKYQISASSVDTPLDLPAGSHRLAVQAMDAANTVFKSTVFITVTSSTPVATQSPIQHLIVIQMQNHSFDNLFGTFPGANGIDPGESSYSQTDANGSVVIPHELSTASTSDLPHSRQSYLNVWDH